MSEEIIYLIFGLGGLLTMLFTVIWMVKNSRKAEIDELYDITEQLRKEAISERNRVEKEYVSKDMLKVYLEGKRDAN